MRFNIIAPKRVGRSGSSNSRHSERTKERETREREKEREELKNTLKEEKRREEGRKEQMKMREGSTDKDKRRIDRCRERGKRNEEKEQL